MITPEMREAGARAICAASDEIIECVAKAIYSSFYLRKDPGEAFPTWHATPWGAPHLTITDRKSWFEAARSGVRVWHGRTVARLADEAADRLEQLAAIHEFLRAQGYSKSEDGTWGKAE